MPENTNKLYDLIYVIPLDCPLDGNPEFLLAYGATVNSQKSHVIRMDVLRMSHPEINWETVARYSLPADDSQAYEWSCSGCTMECKARRVNIGGRPL
jgi:hypothetical protein